MSEALRDKLALAVAMPIATFAGIGRLPSAPGSVAAVITALACMQLSTLSVLQYALCCVVITLLGVWASHVAERGLGRADDSRIVIDEVAGTMWALASIDRTQIMHVAIATAAFRALDILKPWPLRAIERRVHGGLGVMLDDVVAGVFVALLMLALS